MPRAIIYTRVSTDEQAEAGGGMAAQVDACRSWAARSGVEALGPFPDEGISGAAPLDKRPGLIDALGSIGPGDVFLVAKRDRLGRDPIAVAFIEADVKRRGGRVVSAAGEGTDDDSPTNVLMRRIVDAFAEYERLLIRARTRAALGAKRRRGERTGRVPLGFDLVDDGRRSKAGSPIGLAENPAEQAVIAEIRALDAGGMPPARVAADLRSRGVPTKTGASWSNMAVRRILARTAGPNPTR